MASHRENVQKMVHYMEKVLEVDKSGATIYRAAYEVTFDGRRSEEQSVEQDLATAEEESSPESAWENDKELINMVTSKAKSTPRKKASRESDYSPTIQALLNSTKKRKGNDTDGSSPALRNSAKKTKK